MPPREVEERKAEVDSVQRAGLVTNAGAVAKDKLEMEVDINTDEKGARERRSSGAAWAEEDADDNEDPWAGLEGGARDPKVLAAKAAEAKRATEGSAAQAGRPQSGGSFASATSAAASVD